MAYQCLDEYHLHHPILQCFSIYCNQPFLRKLTGKFKKILKTADLRLAKNVCANISSEEYKNLTTVFSLLL